MKHVLCVGGITFWIDKVEEDSNLGGWVYIQTIGSRSLGIIPVLKANKLIEIFRECPFTLSDYYVMGCIS